LKKDLSLAILKTGHAMPLLYVYCSCSGKNDIDHPAMFIYVRCKYLYLYHFKLSAMDHKGNLLMGFL